MSERDTDSSYSAPAGRPSICRNCGAIVGAGENMCGQCGAFVAAHVGGAPPPGIHRSRHETEAMRFARAVFSRPAPFTFLFLIVNIFVFLLMSLSGDSQSDETLLAFGAKYNSLIDAGEWWRFVTPVFIHIGVVHLLFNMYGLWMLGPYVERLYGSARFVVFWMASGVAGVVASYLTVSPSMDDSSLFGRFFFRSLDGPSAGASGALFGLIGVLFVFGIKFRHELPEEFKRAFGTGMLPTILINLFIGYAFPFIDNSAHIGGLLTGAALALVVPYKRIGPRGPVAYAWHFAQIAALVLIVISFTMAIVTHERRQANPPPEATGAAVEEAPFDPIAFVNAFNGGQNALVFAFTNGDASQVPDAIAALDKLPDFDRQADELRDELKVLLLRARQLTREKLPPKQLAEARSDLDLSIRSWFERYNLWLTLDGAKHRIVVKPNA